MVDLKRQHAALKDEIDAGIQEVLSSAQFILGPNVRAFEEEVAQYCGVRHAIAVASGTDALHLALRAAGLRRGDEVITTPFTFIGTVEAIAYLGAKPVFVDIDPRSFNIDPALVEAAITPRTRAVLPVHLFGQPADLDLIAAVCRRHGLKLIEDCAQSFGAEYGGRRSGAYGDAGCFSFFPSKNLGGYGDGGMVVTDDDTIAEEVRVYRNHGSRVQYHHSAIGYNSRLDELQAAILRVKLCHIDRFNTARRRNAAAYTALLAESGLTPPHEHGKGVHVYHQYTVRSERRDAIRTALLETGIACAVYYPVPLHRQEVFQAQWAGASFPHAEAAAASVLSLPMFPELTDEEIERVATVITNCR
jgi:dTDP-4-amino-4,6-dideoxygalactose transaminase